MPVQDPKRWGEQLQNATGRVEEDLRRVVSYINDEVVPDIRRNGSHALRAAAEELHKLAKRMEDSRGHAANEQEPKGPPRP
ncbi:MAG: hypothetical protein NVSMB62_29670 [Acidobacteriaceae bacterium]